jgi:hypothetical protein
VLALAPTWEGALCFRRRYILVDIFMLEGDGRTESFPPRRYFRRRSVSRVRFTALLGRREAYHSPPDDMDPPGTGLEESGPHAQTHRIIDGRFNPQVLTITFPHVFLSDFHVTSVLLDPPSAVEMQPKVVV